VHKDKFKSKTGYTPPPACGFLKITYIKRYELSSLQVRKFRDNFNAMERVSISSLKKDKDIIIKTSDKGQKPPQHTYINALVNQFYHYLLLKIWFTAVA
jgi:hypothetical protein